MADQDMTLNQCKEVVKFSLLHSNAKIKLPVMLWGSHGVGKTEIVKQIAKEMGYNLVVLHLATQDIVDLVGIPTKTEVTDNDGNILDVVQQWACPDWLNKANKRFEETGEPNLFFLDEFNRGPRLVLAAMLPFLIEGVLHQHSIGPKDAVIAAANPPTEDYEVNDLIDKALLNRMAHVIFRPTTEEYINYLKSTGMDKTTINVIRKNPAYAKIPEFELDFEVTPSRRSMDYVMRVIGKMGKTWINKHGSYVIEAFLGPSFRDEWIDEYSNTDQYITIEMLQNYDDYEADITEALTTVIDGVETERVDVLGRTNEIIKQWIEDHRDSLSSNDLEWMIKFYSNPKVPDDAAAATFMANKHIRKRALDDVDFSIALGGFLTDKGIMNDEGVASW